MSALRSLLTWLLKCLVIVKYWNKLVNYLSACSLFLCFDLSIFAVTCIVNIWLLNHLIISKCLYEYIMSLDCEILVWQHVWIFSDMFWFKIMKVQYQGNFETKLSATIVIFASSFQEKLSVLPLTYQWQHFDECTLRFKVFLSFHIIYEIENY